MFTRDCFLYTRVMTARLLAAFPDTSNPAHIHLDLYIAQELLTTARRLEAENIPPIIIASAMLRLAMQGIAGKEGPDVLRDMAAECLDAITSPRD